MLAFLRGSVLKPGRNGHRVFSVSAIRPWNVLSDTITGYIQDYIKHVFEKQLKAYRSINAVHKFHDFNTFI